MARWAKAAAKRHQCLTAATTTTNCICPHVSFFLPRFFSLSLSLSLSPLSAHCLQPKWDPQRDENGQRKLRIARNSPSCCLFEFAYIWGARVGAIACFISIKNTTGSNAKRRETIPDEVWWLQECCRFHFSLSKSGQSAHETQCTGNCTGYQMEWRPPFAPSKRETLISSRCLSSTTIACILTPTLRHQCCPLSPKRKISIEVSLSVGSHSLSAMSLSNG